MFIFRRLSEIYSAILLVIFFVWRPIKKPRFSTFWALEKTNFLLFKLYNFVAGWLVKFPLKMGLFSTPHLVKWFKNSFFLFEYFLLIRIGRPNQLGLSFFVASKKVNWLSQLDEFFIEEIWISWS